MVARRLSSHISFASFQLIPFISLSSDVVDSEGHSIVSFGVSIEVDSGSYDLNWSINSYILVSAGLDLSRIFLSVLLVALWRVVKIRIVFPIVTKSWSKIEVFRVKIF
jgi:hypothetical protein